MSFNKNILKIIDKINTNNNYSQLDEVLTDLNINSSPNDLKSYFKFLVENDIANIIDARCNRYLITSVNFDKASDYLNEHKAENEKKSKQLTLEEEQRAFWRSTTLKNYFKIPLELIAMFFLLLSFLIMNC